MIIVLILLGACAYLWSDNRRLLESRVADAMRSSWEKEEEVKSKGAQIVTLTAEIEGLEKQLVILSQVNEELKRRMKGVEEELRRRAVELEDMMVAEADLKAFYSTVVATKDKELAMLEAGLGREIKKLIKDKEEAEAARDDLEQKNIELRDRVSEYHRRVNDGNYLDEAPKHIPSLSPYSSPVPHQGHRRHWAIGGAQEREKEVYFAPPGPWGYTVPHGMGI